MTKDEALRMALETIQIMNQQGDFSNGVTDPTNTMDEGDRRIGWLADDAIKAIRQALDQLPDTDADYWRKKAEHLEQENFAWRTKLAVRGYEIEIESLRQALAEPPKWVHLLTDEKADIRNSVDYSQFMSAEEYACKVQDATEAKLKELNHD